jgi:MFS family permease
LILFICLGSLSYGYGSSIIATTLGQPTFIHYFELDTRSNGETLIGAINGLFQAGGIFGALSVVYVPDKLGRRWAIFIGGLFCLLGGALQAGSVNIAMFLVARLLSGYGIGGLTLSLIEPFLGPVIDLT